MNAPDSPMQFRNVLARAGRAFARVALQPFCMLCAGRSDTGTLCAPCVQTIPRIPDGCAVCALPGIRGARCGACLRRPPHFDRTVAGSVYEFPVDRLLQAFKYGGALPLAPAFAKLIADARVLRTPDERPVDFIVPVPLARERLRERGFNQAHEVARRVGGLLRLPVRPDALHRTRTTAVQADLALDDRGRNVRGAFAASEFVAGRAVGVVDDVMTSGATLEEIARCLKAAGAIRVENWVVARALLDP